MMKMNLSLIKVQNWGWPGWEGEGMRREGDLDWEGWGDEGVAGGRMSVICSRATPGTQLV